MRIRKKTTPQTAAHPLEIPAPRHARRSPAAMCALAIAASVTACGVGSSAHGQLAQDKQILATCDASAPPASDIQLDGSGSSASKAITEERMAAVEEIVRTTAICSGRLRVLVFSSSSAAATTLFDETLALHGATDNAKLKRVPQLIEGIMTQIRASYGPAVSGLPGGGSDITGQYRLAQEWAEQVGGDYRLHLYLLTDGFETVGGLNLYKKVLTKQEASELVDQMAVPMLTGASVTVAGLGRVAGSPPPSRVAEGLVGFYDALCKKSGAATCLSVTDYAAAGR
ncbi:hypothetical protein [Streptomyces aquilus]|uniref:hypothetical protein n=1 Tax=Streptomyces aquilus TaxID=2548456 RepID=UPI0036BBC9E7